MFNKKLIFLSISHLFILLVGFAIGIYSLPILTAPPSLEIAEINQLEQSSIYEGEFVKDLDGSDLFHWGEAKVSINSKKIIHECKADLIKIEVDDNNINIASYLLSKNIPLCGVLGGGYNKSFDKLIELHSMLHKNCADII